MSNNTKRFYLFALESYDNLIDGFNRLIDRFETHKEALDYYTDNLEYKTNIKYQDDKFLEDVAKCYIWDSQTGKLDLYFRTELKRYLSVDAISRNNRLKSTELKCQETRNIRGASQNRYWFYFMENEGYHPVTDAVIVSKNIMDENEMEFKKRLINKYQEKHNPKHFNNFNGFYMFDSHTNISTLYISKQSVFTYLKQNQYICVLDFEANCNENGDKWINEIIEFPSILYLWDQIHNTFTKVNEIQLYVKPTFNPKITQFCTNLTGITQQTIDEKGIPFKNAFQQHYDWLKKYVPPALLLHSTSMVTCGNWDLMTMLTKECKKHKILFYPSVYKKFINIKMIYKDTMKTPKQYGLANMLKFSSMKMEGRHHSGISDCHNTGRLFEYLIRKGYRFEPSDLIYVKENKIYKHQTYNNTIQ